MTERNDLLPVSEKTKLRNKIGFHWANQIQASEHFKTWLSLVDGQQHVYTNAQFHEQTDHKFFRNKRNTAFPWNIQTINFYRN